MIKQHILTAMSYGNIIQTGGSLNDIIINTNGINNRYIRMLVKVLNKK